MSSKTSSNGKSAATVAKLEQRVAALEQEVATLKARGAGEPVKDWRSTIGMFTGDEMMKEIMDEALKYREKDRERARRKYARQRKAVK